ncbi:hypothetical protein VNI00_011296 [Paramarasmius palmivorus]|uniref:Uncharacterized protein n=1 Tax=Paramarasmius palmivorus TaxID=297713 RepID=A0AAW0CEA5_9AGAR
MDWRRYYYKEAEDREAEDGQAEDGQAEDGQAEDSQVEDSEGEDSEEEEDEDIRTKIYSATGLPVRLGDWRHYYSGLTLQRPGNAFVTIGRRTELLIYIILESHKAREQCSDPDCDRLHRDFSHLHPAVERALPDIQIIIHYFLILRATF